MLAWQAVSNNDSHMIGVVASKIYGDFHNIQCTVAFEPANFIVNVSTTEQTINVSAVDASLIDIADINQTGHLRRNAIWSLNLLLRRSTSLYVSVLGEALAHNLQTVYGNDGDDDALRSAAAPRATSESFNSMLDDILGIYGDSQLVLPSGSAGQTATGIRGEFAALRVSHPLYHYAVLSVNAALLFLILAEGLRTWWWNGLPCFDTLDFESIVDSASSTSVAAAGAWVLQRRGGGEVRKAIVKMVKSGLSDEVGRETGAGNSQYVKVT